MALAKPRAARSAKLGPEAPAVPEAEPVVSPEDEPHQE
jgi:hypothetical protein